MLYSDHFQLVGFVLRLRKIQLIGNEAYSYSSACAKT
jgi:hypothetical protein